MGARETAVGIAMDLRKAGHEAFLAGGCVRDEALKRTPNDWDVATSAPPEQVNDLFRNTRSVGEAFGVVLVHRDGFITEVATFRADGPYGDHRRPETVVYTDALQDAMRRDFTVNGLFRDPETDQVIDHVDGLADLEAGIIRAIGTPADRFDEDHLRMLRAVRFAAALDFSIDEETAAAVRLHAGSLSGVSRERIGQEMRHMLQHASAVRAMQLLRELELESTVFGRVPTGDLEHLTAAVHADLDFVGRLAALALDREANVERIAEQWTPNLTLSNAHRDGVMRVLEIYAQLLNWGDLAVAQQRRVAGAPGFVCANALLGVRAPYQTAAVESAVAPWAASLGGVLPPRLLDGGAILDAGVPAGPGLGCLLEAIYDAQLDGRVQSVDDAHGLLRSLRAVQD